MRNEAVRSPHSTATHRGQGLCSAATHNAILSHVCSVTAATHARAIYHVHKIFIFHIVIWPLFWKYYYDSLLFMGWMQRSFGKQSRLLTYGEHTRVNVSAKGID